MLLLLKFNRKKKMFSQSILGMHFVIFDLLAAGFSFFLAQLMSNVVFFARNYMVSSI